MESIAQLPTTKEIASATEASKLSAPPTAPLEIQQELVSRIAESSHLNKSLRLTELLRFLTQRAMLDPHGAIHEQEIGACVFGKPTDYDTSQDNIVRVQVSQLRKKIERYYATDGADELWELEIPRGSYLPVFRARHTIAPTDAPLPPVMPVAEVTGQPVADRTTHRFWWWAMTGGFITSLCLCGWLFWQNRQLRQNVALPNPTALAPSTAPALQSLWSRLLVRNQQTDIVLADTMLSLFQDRLDAQLKLQEYLNRDYEDKLLTPYGKTEREHLANIMLRRYTSFADVIVLQRLLRVAEGSGVQPNFHFARDFQIRDLKTHNVIMLGSKRSNLWNEMFEPQTNFRFFYQAHRLRVINTTPRAGELPVYESANPESGYAILAFLPNLDRTGNVLLLQGGDGISTEGAGEFVTSEAPFAQFQSQIMQGRAHLPWFEALLKVTKVGNTARNLEVVAFRLLQ